MRHNQRNRWPARGRHRRVAIEYVHRRSLLRRSTVSNGRWRAATPSGGPLPPPSPRLSLFAGPAADVPGSHRSIWTRTVKGRGGGGVQAAGKSPGQPSVGVPTSSTRRPGESDTSTATRCWKSLARGHTPTGWCGPGLPSIELVDGRPHGAPLGQWPEMRRQAGGEYRLAEPFTSTSAFMAAPRLGTTGGA